MQSKRDQLQAHNFVVGRLRSALLRGDADAPETPTRRFSASTFAGILVGALLVAACGVYGMVFPGGDRTWRQPGTIVVERETGTRYLFVDGVLRPVLNLPSARLLAGAGAKVRSVSEKSLRGVPHGLPVGIPGAPDSLPDPARLVTDSWLVCATRVATGPNSTRPGVTVSLGQRSDTVRPLGAGAVPLTAPDGAVHLAWRDRRLRLPDASAALVAFGYRGTRPVSVPAQWLNAVPQGPDLVAPPVDGIGREGPVVGGRPTWVGQVLVAQTTAGTSDYYLVLTDGLAAVAPAAAGLLLADPDTRAAYGPGPVRPLEVSLDGVAAAPQSKTPPDWTDRPTGPPPVVEPADGEVPCAALTFAADGQPAVALVLARPGPASAGVRPGADAGTADQVSVPPGRGMLARSQPSPGATGRTLYLVTDLGIKYPLPSAEVAGTLGYAGRQPVEVPAAMLALLPTGPVLDPAAAGATFLAD
ncbi:type VII secretion protein EccB [Micromonospora echinofusca]|uniref:Type VII secretion protein EccB n=1 Tax=Micromonospora echinofusca TaxID=47858 RepID=A0ABS3VS64_MICEH|nr:type VII secretion protein EccB [Micromonospora echinofusca]MBO4207311.1 type VII secretion protein EccB [Micromonospora echinofusca]